MRIERFFAIDPAGAIYIDDVVANTDAALSFGIHAVRFSGPKTLRAELAGLGLL